MADDSDMADVASSTGNGLAGVPFMYNDPVLREFEGSSEYHCSIPGHTRCADLLQSRTMFTNSLMDIQTLTSRSKA